MVINILCFIFTALFLYEVIVKKRIFTAVTYIWAGIYVPLFLYNLNWSFFIISIESYMFDYIFFCLTLCGLLFSLLSGKLMPAKIEIESIRPKKYSKYIILTLSIIYIVLYLIENYLGSGSFVPGLIGKDIHTFSAPIISYITNTLYLVYIANYIGFRIYKNKVFIFIILFCTLLPVATRSSRMLVLVSLLQFLSFVIFVEKGNALKNIKSKRNYKRNFRVIFVSICVFICGLVAFTNYRMSHYGVYDISFNDVIGFSGPDWASFLSVYYGYFPLSFNNLKLNLISRIVEHNYLGIYSFSCIYFGLLQLDNVIGIDPGESIRGRLLTSNAATVPTAFWEYYYDYGILLFIPIVLAFFITWFLLKKASKERHSIVYRTLYFWFIPLWFFESFQNTLFSSTMLISTIFIYFFIKRLFAYR